MSPDHAGDLRRYRLLLRAGRLFNEVVELEPLLFAIRDFVREALDAESVSLAWLSKTGERGHALVSHNDIRLPDVESIGEPIQDDDYRDAIESRSARAQEIGGGAQLTAPLVRGGEVRGVIRVTRSVPSPPFRDDEIELLEALGEDIVVSVSNAYLYERVLRVSEENQLLYAISRDVGATLEVEALIDRLLEHLRRIVPYDAAGLYLNRPGDITATWLGHRGYPVDATEHVRLKLGEGLVGRVAESGQPVRVGDVSREDGYIAARPDTRSEMVVPLRGAAGAVIGAFNVESDKPNAFTKRDLERLEAFASLAGVAMEREASRRLRQEKRRLDQELALARRIQEAFQPHVRTEIPGFQVWGRQIPAIEMSGDYFDVIPISEFDYGIVIADVSGKGVPAALIMASLRAALISEVRSRYTIRRVMHEVNTLLVESTEPGGFATVFYGVLNTKDKSLTFVNAGHDPPLLRSKKGTLRPLITGGTILGAFPDLEFADERVQLRTGDTLVMNTDGIPEARNSSGEFFGSERLEYLVANASGLTPKEVGESIFAAVHEFSDGGPPEDDQTLLVIQPEPKVP